MATTWRYYRSAEIGDGSLRSPFRNKLNDPPYSVRTTDDGQGYWEWLHKARAIRYTLCACDESVHALTASDTDITALSPEFGSSGEAQGWLDGLLSGMSQGARDRFESDGISLAWASAPTDRKEAFRYASKLHVICQDIAGTGFTQALEFLRRNLDTTRNQLTVAQRNAISQWCSSKGLSTSWTTSTTTVRELLQYVIENIQWPPLPLGPVTLR